MLQPEKLRYHRLWLTLGFCLLILIGYKSLEPIQIAVEGFDHIDLVLHFLAYFVLTAWFQQIHTRQSLLLIAVAITLYSGVLELAQNYVPIRKTNWSDFLTNLSGILFATFLNRTALHGTLKSFEKKFMPA